MDKKKFRAFQRINKKYCGYVVGFIVLVFITSTIFAIKAIGQPLFLEEKEVTNSLEEKTSFDYGAVVIPSHLYPNGGIVKEDNVIFNNLSQELIIYLDTSINSEKPVKIEGTREVTYSLIAKDMWEREFVLSPVENIKIEGITNQLLQKKIHINLKEILNYINLTEEETLVRPNYTMIIKPKIIGNVYEESNAENSIHEINNQIEIPFELSGQYVKYVGESKEKEFLEKVDIERINTIPQYFNFFGFTLLIVGARYGFTITSIISLILIIIFILEKLNMRKQTLNKIKIIDKKNKSKIVTIMNKIDFNTVPKLLLNNFKDLLRIAEEKEETILKYTDEENGDVYYYIVSSTFIYLYKYYNISSIEGSELANDI